MKKMIYLTLLSAGLTAMAQGLSVRASDIAGKTDLIVTVKTTVNGKASTVIADANSMTLYTFEQDGHNVSRCSGNCLEVWAPEEVPSGAKVAAPFAVIRGNNGRNQLTIEGRPLYHYDDDKKPGDAFGQYPQWDTVSVIN